MASAPVSWTHVVALADALEALIRADIPLDIGVRDFALRSRGALHREATVLADRLQQGASLEAALREQPRLPPVFRAMVVAGTRTGRPAEVLQGFTSISRELLELRQVILRGLSYPLLLAGMSYALFAGLIAWGTPHASPFLRGLSDPPPWWTDVLLRLHGAVHWWGPGLPGALLAFGLLWRVLRGRGGSPLWGWRWLGARRLIRDAQLAEVSSVLALLAEFDAPLPEGLRLAGGLVDARSLREDLQQLADALESGQPAAEAVERRRALPPLWRWMFSTGARNSQLAPALREAAALYRQRATLRAERLAVFVPACLLLVIGGGSVAVYAVTLFLPMAEMWTQLTRSF